LDFSCALGQRRRFLEGKGKFQLKNSLGEFWEQSMRLVSVIESPAFFSWKRVADTGIAKCSLSGHPVDCRFRAPPRCRERTAVPIFARLSESPARCSLFPRALGSLQVLRAPQFKSGVFRTAGAPVTSFRQGRNTLRLPTKNRHSSTPYCYLGRVTSLHCYPLATASACTAASCEHGRRPPDRCQHRRRQQLGPAGKQAVAGQLQGPQVHHHGPPHGV